MRGISTLAREMLPLRLRRRGGKGPFNFRVSSPTVVRPIRGWGGDLGEQGQLLQRNQEQDHLFTGLMRLQSFFFTSKVAFISLPQEGKKCTKMTPSIHNSA